MKKNDKQNDNDSTRKFWVTRCPVCNSIDAAVEILKAYDSTRDRNEWLREGRKVTEYTQINRAPLPWCECLLDEEVPSPKQQ